MGLFDVAKAEKNFNNLLTKPIVNELLKRAKKGEEANYTAENIIKKIGENQQVIGKYEKLFYSVGVLLGRDGIVYLLSTRPHTDSNSNFVRLVKNKVVSNQELIKYFVGRNSDYNPKPVRDSLLRYLKLEKDKNKDVVPESETDENLKGQLERKKNKDLFEKMNSRRKVNRLKVVIVALIINLIDFRINHPDEFQKPILSENDFIYMLENGMLTAAEFDCIDIDDFRKNYNDKLKKVIIPNGVTEIREYHFDFFYKLEKVVIPNTVTKIEQSAFRFCNNLKRITIPGSVTTIDTLAFAQCEGLTELTIENGVKKIDWFAFHKCPNLRRLKIPGTVKEIGGDAFADCKGLTELIIEYGTEEIGMSAFKNCTNLTTITIPDSVTEIDDEAFNRCRKIVTVNACPRIKKIIGEQIGNQELVAQAEAEERNSSSHPIPQSSGASLGVTVQESGSTEAEKRQLDAERQKLADERQQLDVQRQKLADEKRQLDAQRQGITGQGGVGKGQAGNNGSVQGSTTNSTNQKKSGLDEWFERDKQRKKWKTQGFTVAEFNGLEYGDLIGFDVVRIPQGVTEIKSGVFVYRMDPDTVWGDNDDLHEVFIPKSVKKIQKGAFEQCKELTSVHIEAGGNLEIGEDAFVRCFNLGSINIPPGTKSIGINAFRMCDKLKSVTIPGSIKTLSERAFLQCDILENVTIDEGVSKIDKMCFDGCISLKTISVPKSLQSIGEKAFDGCPKDITVLGAAIDDIKNKIREQAGARDKAKKEEAKHRSETRDRMLDIMRKLANGTETNVKNFTDFIKYCVSDDHFWWDDDKDRVAPKVTKIVVPNGVKEIYGFGVESYFGFVTFKNLQDVVIPQSVKTIKDSCFRGCKILNHVNINGGVTVIGDSAFKECESLPSIDLPDSLLSLGARSFSGCITLGSITIPNKISEIKGNSFRDCAALTEITINTDKIIGEGAFDGCPSDMKILGTASEDTKNEIRRQIGQPEVKTGEAE